MRPSVTQHSDSMSATSGATGVARSASAAGSSVGQLVSSRALSLWRRLDWRFLLPDPNLQSVGYFGPSCDLLTALQMFSQSVVVFSDSTLHAAYPEFDLVVLRHPSPDTVELAGRMVRPGGSLYLELAGPLRGLSARKVLSRSVVGLVGYASALWKLGCDEVQAYWHRPTFEECREIVPIFDRLAMSSVLSRHGPLTAARQAKLAMSRSLLHAGLLRYVIPCYSVVAHKKDRS